MGLDKIDVTGGSAPSNDPPTVTNPGNQTHTENDSVSVQIEASDTDAGDTLSYSATGLPNGLSINSSTGLITGTATTVGTFNSTVTVNDGNGGSDNASFTWTVQASGGGGGNTAPTITNPGAQSNTEGETASLQIQASDPDTGDTLSYSATQLPTGLSINSSSGLISGTVTTEGVFNPIITVDDSSGGSNSVSFAWNIQSGLACTAESGSSAVSRITVPNSSDATVGAISGQHSVSSSGDASYSIPIGILPGTAGVSPKLSLEYSSGSGNGIFGLGFQLSGLSSVSRCGTTIVQDGAFGGVDLDTNDKFCIDGARLLAINGGTYGANGTEYRTEINSFNKIVSLGTAGSGPEKFQVWTKSGEILEYGFTADSKITINSDVLTWSLNKLTDTAGNAFNVIYNYDGTKYEQTPHRIEYTENTSAGLTADKYIEFAYETRGDKINNLIGTTVLEVDERVTQLSIGEGVSDEKRYKFSYVSRTNYEDSSLLEQIEECYLDDQNNEQCLPATTLGWQESSGDLAFSAPDDTWGTFEAGKQGGYTVGDFDGDGRHDWLYIQEVGGTSGNKNIYVRRSTGASFGTEEIWSTYYASCSTQCTQTNPLTGGCVTYGTVCSTPPSILVMDYDGDGKDDIRIGNNVHHSNGSSFWSSTKFCNQRWFLGRY